MSSKLLPDPEGTRNQNRLTLKDSIGGLMPANRTCLFNKASYEIISRSSRGPADQPCNQNAPGASPSIPRWRKKIKSPARYRRPMKDPTCRRVGGEGSREEVT